MVTRLAAASPRNIERFHLRLLLLHVKGATSYEDLRTVDGVVCQTFVQACVLRGITTDDSEWDRTLEEAVTWQFPRQLRELFAMILVHCLPKEPGLLWEKYQDSFSEDYVRDLGPEEGTNRAYEEIVLHLESMGMSLADFPDMPELPGNRWGNDVIDVDYHKVQAERLYAMLNPDQRRIVDEVLQALGSVNFLRKRCFYIDGPAGVGKSFTYRYALACMKTMCCALVFRTIFHCVRALGKRCITTASTGIAATVLPCGQTWHSLWKLPVPLLSDSESSVKRSRQLEEASVIILDEAPMLSRFGLAAAERKIRELKRSLEPFGGVIFILGKGLCMGRQSVCHFVGFRW